MGTLILTLLKSSWVGWVLKDILAIYPSNYWPWTKRDDKGYSITRLKFYILEDEFDDSTWFWIWRLGVSFVTEYWNRRVRRDFFGEGLNGISRVGWGFLGYYCSEDYDSSWIYDAYESGMSNLTLYISSSIKNTNVRHVFLLMIFLTLRETSNCYYFLICDVLTRS